MDLDELAVIAVELEERDVTWCLQITPAQAVDLASGYVPSVVRAQAIYALTTEDRDRRRTARPVLPRNKRSRR